MNFALKPTCFLAQRQKHIIQLNIFTHIKAKINLWCQENKMYFGEFYAPMDSVMKALLPENDAFLNIWLLKLCWDMHRKCGSLADFTFFKVECKKQGKSHNAYIS